MIAQYQCEKRDTIHDPPDPECGECRLDAERLRTVAMMAATIWAAPDCRANEEEVAKEARRIYDAVDEELT